MSTKFNNSPSCSVSVVMPAYNAEKHIVEAILSVQQQTMSNWELIIIDDCSTDNTFQIIQKMANLDNRIHVAQNEKNQGPGRTRNLGFSMSKGKYIALLDSDDVWKSEKLEKQVFLAETTHADIVFCSYEIIDDDGNSKCRDFIVPETVDYQSALVKSVMSCSTVLLKKELTETYFFTNEFYHEDLVYWLQLLWDGKKAVGIKDILAAYRVTEQSRASDKLTTAQNRWRVYKDFCHFSNVKCIKLMLKYTVLGLKKYREV